MSDIADSLRALADGLDQTANNVAEAKQAAADLERLSAERDRVAAEVQSLRSDLDLAAQRRSAVRDVLDFYEGRITHIVEAGSSWSAPTVMTLTEALRTNNEHVRQRLHLFALRLNKRGTGVEWHRNQYSDGSGRWSGIAVCRSLQDAFEWVEELFGDDVSRWRENNSHGSPALWRGYRDSDARLQWPDELLTDIARRHNDERDKTIAKARKTLDEAEAVSVLSPSAWLAGEGS